MWFFLFFSTLCWGIAEIFYKKGNLANEKYSHLKTTVFVGFFMGIYALIILFSQNIDLKAFPINFVRYLPVAFCYIISMTFSYFGIRYIEESLSDPIENTSGAFVAIMCAIFLHESINVYQVIAIIIITIGILCVGLLDKEGKEKRKKNLGIKLAIVSICMPFCYMILDAIGTFLDIFYTDSVETTYLINVTEDNLEHTANCAYELTFFLVSIILYIFLRIKKVKLFETKSNNIIETIKTQKDKMLAALFEVGGQATYLFALSEGTGIAAVILGAGTVIVSLILSRIFLKEKLSILQYIFIGIIISGIILLSLLGL